MNMHKNARLTLLGRERVVRRVESGQTPEAVSEAAGVCPRSPLTEDTTNFLTLAQQSPRQTRQDEPICILHYSACSILPSCQTAKKPVSRPRDSWS